jgi:hypothetical protein
MNDSAVQDSASSQRRPRVSERDSSAGATSPSDGRRRVHLVLQGKGGIGKTFAANLLVQYHQHIGRPVKAYDCDPVNASLVGVPALRAESVELMDADEDVLDVARTDQFVETLLTSQDDVVIDSGAASFVPLSRYLIDNRIAELLANGGRELVVHTIVTGGGSVIETLKGLEAVVLHFPDTVRVVVWTNEFFGPVRYENTAFEEMAIYREAKPRISGRITLKELNRRTFGANLATLLERKLTFSEALSSNSAFNTVERKRCSATLRRTAGSGWPLVRPEPRHQFIDAVLRPAIHQACDEIGEIDLRIDAIQLTGLDQRRQACPILSAFVRAGAIMPGF